MDVKRHVLTFLPFFIPSSGSLPAKKKEGKTSFFFQATKERGLRSLRNGLWTPTRTDTSWRWQPCTTHRFMCFRRHFLFSNKWLHVNPIFKTVLNIKSLALLVLAQLVKMLIFSFGLLSLRRCLTPHASHYVACGWDDCMGESIGRVVGWPGSALVPHLSGTLSDWCLR